MSTFISLGNGTQAFPRLVDWVLDIEDILPKPIRIQCGVTSVQSDLFSVVDFLPLGDFQHYMATSSVIIIHGGAGSILHALNCGKVPIVIPRLAKFSEVIDDHQMELAYALDKQGRVILVGSVAELKRAVFRVDSMRIAGIAHPTSSALVEMVRRQLYEWS